MANKSFGTVEANSSKVDDQEREPLDGLKKRSPENFLLQLMAHHTESNRAQAIEDNDEGKPDSPRRHIQVVELIREETDDDVVRSREEEA